VSFFLSPKASRARFREAENARQNRAEIIQAWSQGQITRREMVKWGLIWGLITAAGLWAPINGLSPFAKSAFGQIPTGAPRSPLFGVQPFTQPLYRFDVLPRHPEPGFLDPVPTRLANTTPQPLDPALVASYPRTGDPNVDNFGPIEGRPPTDVWGPPRLHPLPA